MAGVEISGGAIRIAGKPTQIISGTIHYFRIRPEQWRDRIAKAKMMGLNAVETYVCHNLHEPKPGQFDFAGMLDLEAFLDEIHRAGLYAIVRPGPYICAEWENGGLPAWLSARPGVEFRCMNPAFLAANDRYLNTVLPLVKKHLYTAGGPVIMGWALAGSTWQNGYRIVSVLQFVLTALLLFSLPLWQTPADAGAGEEFTPEHRTISELLKVPGVPEVMLCFAFYSGVEGIAGMWAASYCTLTRGLDAMTAASWASLFYVGITVGRFFSGFLTMKFNDQQMIRMGQLLNAVGIVLILLPFGNALLPVGLVVAGLGCAPIYPSIIHETPSNFGKNLSMSMTGLQMAAAYTGSTLLSPLFGVLAQNITMKLYPFVLLLMLVLMTVFSEQLHRKTAAKRAANA